MKRWFILFITAVMLCGYLYIFRIQMISNDVAPINVDCDLDDSHERFLVNTPACVIPAMNAYDPTVKKYVHVKKQVTCFKYHFITYRDNYKIIVNETTIFKYFKSTFNVCRYVPFTKDGSSDRNYRLWPKKGRNFTEAINATDAFAIVYCFAKNGSLIEQQAYAFVFRNKTLDRIMEMRYKRNDTNKRPMNILLLGFESTSRLNFVRHMNWTYSFLMKDLQAVEIMGYNKVGLNTFPNMVPILTGMAVNEMHYKSGYLDKYPFVWKNFSDSGYRTFMSEDYCAIGTFTYLKKGFAKPPVDHYWRTYMLAKDEKNRHGYCAGNQLIVEAIIDSMVEFVEVYADVPYFAFSVVSRPTHDNPNGLGIEDLPYYKMLMKLKNKKTLDNTVIIFIGDHGSRYGSLRNTFQGRLEENLPALYITLPEWFRKDNKRLYENLKINARRLTSNFDIYATLMDIIYIGKGKFSYTHKGRHGISLLRNIPRNRTCSSIGIPLIYCACSSYTKINSSDAIVQTVSAYVVKNINHILSNVTKLCAKLKLKNVIRAHKTTVSERFISEKHTRIVDYVTTLEVNPSKALFEAGVRYDFDTKNMTLLGAISRLNKYRGQADCLPNKTSKMVTERYCFCKNTRKSL